MADIYEGFVRPSAGVVDTPIAAVRNDLAGVLVATNNTYQPVQMDSGGSLRITSESGKATFYGVSTFACDATATDIAQILGVTTKIIKVIFVEVWSAATATADGVVKLVKRTAADTAGTPANSSITPAVTATTAAAQPVHYTAHPTALGTGTDVWAKRLGQQALGTVAGCTPLIFDLCPKFGAQGFRIKNVTTESLCVNAPAALGGSGNTWSITWCWTEEPITA